jgi:hypothetical protein
METHDDFFFNVRIRALIAKAPRGKTGGAETFQLLKEAVSKSVVRGPVASQAHP